MSQQFGPIPPIPPVNPPPTPVASAPPIPSTTSPTMPPRSPIGPGFPAPGFGATGRPSGPQGPYNPRFPGGPVPPPPPPYGHPQVVHISARPGGLWPILGSIVGIVALSIVFGAGILVGVVGMIGGASYESMVLQETYRDGSGDTIAIIPVYGGIDEFTAEFVRASVHDVLSDDSIQAVVLRVDSPGGGVAPSDQIWHAMEQLKSAGVPVIASYGGMAASGGYYISCGADHIIAEETCVTGSIGVIAQVLTMEGLMEKVGIQPVTIVASGSPEKDVANDMFRTWNEKDRAKIKIMLDSAYATFNQRVYDGRLSVISDRSRIDALANGDIYTAQQAKDNGLIDGIGYLDDAIAQAEVRAGLLPGRATVVMMRQPPAFFADGLLGEARGGHSRERPLNGETIRGLVNDLASPRVMYLMH
jgi:protease IV